MVSIRDLMASAELRNFTGMPRNAMEPARRAAAGAYWPPG
jgi:hypothetical protein